MNTTETQIVQLMADEIVKAINSLNAKNNQTYVNNQIANHKMSAANVSSDLYTRFAGIAAAEIAAAKIQYAQIDELDVYIANIAKANIAEAKIDAAQINQLDATVANIADASIKNAKIETAQITDLNAKYAQVDMANVSKEWIENSVIKDAVIKTIQATDISANQITAGELDASQIAVRNLNADNITAGTINGQRIGEGSIALEKLNEAVATKSEFETVTNNLQKQIDGAINTFTVEHIPTLNNYPASEWTTDEAKNAHVGDIAYVTNEALDEDGMSYRFSYSPVTGYYWVIVQDTSLSKVFGDIADLNESVDALKTFETNTSQWITQTETDLQTKYITNSNIETKFGDFVNTDTFATGVVGAFENSNTFKTLQETNTALTNTVNSVKQTADANTSSIRQLNVTASGDANNYSRLNDSTAEYWGFTADNTADGHWYTMNVLSRDKYISNYYDCLGGEQIRIQFQISTSAQGNVNRDETGFGYVGTAIGLYCWDSNRANARIVYSKRTTGSADAPVTTVDTTVTIPDGMRTFRVFVQTDAFSGFTGTLKIRNIVVSRMTVMESKYTTLSQTVDGFMTDVGRTYQTKADMSGYSTTAQMNTAISQSADSVTTSAKAYTDNVKVGGRNLARNTHTVYTASTSSSGGRDTWSWMQHEGGYFDQDIEDLYIVESGVEYTLSFDYEITNPIDGMGCGIGLRRKDLAEYSEDTWVSNASYVTYGGSNTSGHFVYKLEPKVLNTGYEYTFAFRPLVYGSAVVPPRAIVIKIWNFKMEKGNRDTGWTPAPEDVSEDIVSAQNAAVTIAADAIKSWVASSGGSTSYTQTSDGFVWNTNKGFVTGDEFNNLEVGGRNILTDTTGFEVVSTKNEVSTHKHTAFDVPNPNQYRGKHLMLSFYRDCIGDVQTVTGVDGNLFGVYVQYNVNSSIKTVATNYRYATTSSLGRVSVPVEIPDGNVLYIRVHVYTYAYPAATNPNTWTIKELKLEVGNKATDWSPAPEDVYKGIDNAAKVADAYMDFNTTNPNALTVGNKINGAFTGTTAVLGGDSLEFKKGNESLASFGGTTRIGGENKSNFTVNGNNLEAKDANGTTYFSVSADGMTYGATGNKVATIQDLNKVAAPGVNLLRNTGGRYLSVSKAYVTSGSSLVYMEDDNYPYIRFDVPSVTWAKYFTYSGDMLDFNFYKDKSMVFAIDVMVDVEPSTLPQQTNTFLITLETAATKDISAARIKYKDYPYNANYLTKGEWKRLEIPFTLGALNFYTNAGSTGESNYFRISICNHSGASMYFRNAKLELGEFATAWSESPGDTVDKVYSNSVTINDEGINMSHEGVINVEGGTVNITAGGQFSLINGNSDEGKQTIFLNSDGGTLDIDTIKVKHLEADNINSGNVINFKGDKTYFITDEVGEDKFPSWELLAAEMSDSMYGNVEIRVKLDDYSMTPSVFKNVHAALIRVHGEIDGNDPDTSIYGEFDIAKPKMRHMPPLKTEAFNGTIEFRWMVVVMNSQVDYAYNLSSGIYNYYMCWFTGYPKGYVHYVGHTYIFLLNNSNVNWYNGSGNLYDYTTPYSNRTNSIFYSNWGSIVYVRGQIPAYSSVMTRGGAVVVASSTTTNYTPGSGTTTSSTNAFVGGSGSVSTSTTNTTQQDPNVKQLTARPGLSTSSYYSGRWNSDLRQGYSNGKRHIYGSMWFDMPTATSGWKIKSVDAATITLTRVSGVGRSSGVSGTLYAANTQTRPSGIPSTGNGAGFSSLIGGQTTAPINVTSLVSDMFGKGFTSGGFVLDTGESSVMSGREYSNNYAEFSSVSMSITYTEEKIQE